MFVLPTPEESESLDFEEQALLMLKWKSLRHEPSGKDVQVPMLPGPFGDAEYKMELRAQQGFVQQKQLGVSAGCSQLWWLLADEMTEQLSLNEPLSVVSLCTICSIAADTGIWSGVLPMKDVCQR